MKITYETTKSFYEGIYQCVVKGLTFNADGEFLTIELLGGY